MRGAIVFLIVVVAILVCIAPFTLMDQLRRFLPQVYDALTGNGDQQETGEPAIETANITRNFNESLSRYFITPRDRSVIELKNTVLRDKPILTPNWMAFRDWVGANIRYRSDREIHDEDDYWQFPNETIPLKTGDCEDFSTLLCSLLRADGWDSDKVYVIVGENNNQYHAWVRLTWENMQYNVEPQGNGFAIAMGDVLSLSGYRAKYFFNDEKLGTFE